MKNWLVCASVTDAARKIIEENGGTIEVLSENVYEDGQRVKPKLLLVTINDALYNGRHTDYHYFSYVLSSNRSGICFWDDDPIAQTIYAWDGKNPNDPELRRGLEPDAKLPWEEERVSEQEQPYKPTPADHALYSSLTTGMLCGLIQQAYIDGKMDEETYDTLFKKACEANREVRKLLDMLEEAEKK